MEGKKKIAVFIIFLTLFSISGIVNALPVIQNFSISPQLVWLGRSATISLVCFDSQNNSISKVYAEVTGPNLIIPPLDMENQSNGTYTLTLDNIYLDRTGSFDVTATCENNNSETTTATGSFKVSELTGTMGDIVPSQIYTDSVIQTNIMVMQDSTALSHDVSFKAYYNGVETPLLHLPSYDLNKGWQIAINAPSEPGTYELMITAFYDTNSISFSRQISVQGNITFSIKSISSTSVKPNDEITLTLEALERGNVIPLTEEDLTFNIGSAEANILSLYRSGNSYVVDLKLPEKEPGTYDLVASLSYSGSTFSDTTPITYVVDVSGSLINLDGKPINAQIKFISDDGTIKSFVTDSSGAYTGTIAPGIYDILLEHEDATLRLYDVNVKDFNDPIKFYIPSLKVEGVSAAGLFVYELALNYDKATLTMQYDPKKVVDESKIEVWGCSSWSSSNGQCLSDWVKLNAVKDFVRNKVRIEA